MWISSQSIFYAAVIINKLIQRQVNVIKSTDNNFKWIGQYNIQLNDGNRTHVYQPSKRNVLITVIARFNVLLQLTKVINSMFSFQEK